MMMDSRADALVVLVCGLSESTSRWTNPVKTADIIETALVQLCNQVSMIFKNPTHPCKGLHVTNSLQIQLQEIISKAHFPAP